MRQPISTQGDTGMCGPDSSSPTKPTKGLSPGASTAQSPQPRCAIEARIRAAYGQLHTARGRAHVPAQANLFLVEHPRFDPVRLERRLRERRLVREPIRADDLELALSH